MAKALEMASSVNYGILDPPDGPQLRTLWFRVVGMWGILKGSCGVLDDMIRYVASRRRYCRHESCRP